MPIKMIRFTAYEEWMKELKDQHNKDQVKHINARRTKAQIRVMNEKWKPSKLKQKDYDKKKYLKRKRSKPVI